MTARFRGRLGGVLRFALEHSTSRLAGPVGRAAPSVAARRGSGRDVRDVRVGAPLSIAERMPPAPLGCLHAVAVASTSASYTDVVGVLHCDADVTVPGVEQLRWSADGLRVLQPEREGVRELRDRLGCGLPTGWPLRANAGRKVREEVGRGCADVVDGERATRHIGGGAVHPRRRHVCELSTDQRLSGGGLHELQGA